MKGIVIMFKKKKKELNGLNFPLNDYPSKIPVKHSLEQACEFYTLDISVPLLYSKNKQYLLKVRTYLCE